MIGIFSLRKIIIFLPLSHLLFLDCLNLYIKQKCLSVCLSVTFGVSRAAEGDGKGGQEGGVNGEGEFLCRGRRGGWIGRRGAMGRGDFYDGMLGWT